MKKAGVSSALSTLALALVVPIWSPIVAAQLVINTPVLTTCQNTSLTWTGAAPGDIYLSIVPGGQPAAQPIASFPPIQGSLGSYTWLVDQPEKSSLTFLVTDSTGVTAGSAAVTVKKGFTEDCIKSTSSKAGAESSTGKETTASTASSTSNKSDSNKDSGFDNAAANAGSKTDSPSSMMKPKTGSNDTTNTPPVSDTDNVSSIKPPTISPINVSSTPPPTENTTAIKSSTPTSTSTESNSDDAMVLQQKQIVLAIVALSVATIFLGA